MMVATSPRANSQVTSASTTTIFTAASRDEHPGRGPRAERPRAMDGRFDFDRAQLVGRARRTRCGTRRVQSAPRARWNAMSWRFSPTQKTRDDDTHFRCHRRQQQSSSTRKLSALFSRGLSVRPAETYGSPCRSPCRSPSARAFPGHARLCMHFVHHTTRLHITHTPPDPRRPLRTSPTLVAARSRGSNERRCHLVTRASLLRERFDRFDRHRSRDVPRGCVFPVRDEKATQRVSRESLSGSLRRGGRCRTFAARRLASECVVELDEEFAEGEARACAGEKFEEIDGGVRSRGERVCGGPRHVSGRVGEERA